MFRNLTIVALVFSAAALATGCRGKSVPLGCSSSDECPSAHVCQGGQCEALCDGDNDCPGGMRCDGTVCVPGSTQAPEISGVTGNSSQTCNPSGGVAGPCIGTGFVVTGSYLASATFALRALEAGLSDVTLTTGARVQDSLVDVLPTTTVPAGTYTLVAVNAAGSASQAVTVLQGEPGAMGPSGPAGSAGTAGTNGKDGNATGGGSGAVVYLYDNTSATNNSGTLTSSESVGDRLVVRVKAKSGDTISQSIDDTKLMALCSDADGCTVTLGLSGWQEGTQHATNLGGEFKALFTGPSCRMSITADRHWAVSPSCYTTYAQIESTFVAADWTPTQAMTYTQWYASKDLATSSASKARPDNPQLLRYRPLGSARAGIDGTNTGNDETVLNFLNGCLFAEAPEGGLESGYPVYQDDTTAGFYLVAAGTDWTSPPTQWTQSSNRTCALIIED